MIKQINQLTQQFLAHRPAFFALIRPIEAYLMQQQIAKLKQPILDFGCGDGFFAKQVIGQQKLAVGLDIKTSRAKQAQAQQVYQKIVFYEGNKIPFKTNYFGGVIANSVLEHLPQLTTNLQEIHRVLKPSGLFLTTVMTNRWEQYLLGKKFFGQWYADYLRKKQVHENLLSWRQWQKQFAKAGFKVIKKTGYLSPTTSAWLDLMHYFSWPSLVSYQVFKKWVVWPSWYRWLPVTKLINHLNQQSFTPLSQAAAVFFVLKKN
ncbi:MAG: methyltransferase domain-containing protein [Candidatus Pacebacteria bacterium]|nr:methyltransferase domain-containing protein [Candidatus Paceibacterota bacterium]